MNLNQPNYSPAVFAADVKNSREGGRRSFVLGLSLSLSLSFFFFFFFFFFFSSSSLKSAIRANERSWRSPVYRQSKWQDAEVA